MAQPSGRDIVERLGRAIEAQDFDTIAALVADDYVEEYPPSRGSASVAGPTSRRSCGTTQAASARLTRTAAGSSVPRTAGSSLPRSRSSGSKDRATPISTWRPLSTRTAKPGR